MAEHFTGRHHTIHFSNGAAEQLLRAWIHIGEKLPPTLHNLTVLHFLRDRLRHGDGWRAFPLDPPPPELSHPQSLSALSTMIAGFADDVARICKGCPFQQA